MHKTVKLLFIFSLLLIFLSNVSGISVSLEHAAHSTSAKMEKKNNKEKSAVLSKDDQCQCALQLHMNTCVLPETHNIQLAFLKKESHEFPHLKTSAYHRIIDYLSSRAPPSLS